MKYRKKPVVIEAIQFDPSTDDGRQRAMQFCEGYLRISIHQDTRAQWGEIDSLEGRMRAEPGDWIIRGVKGEFYPCKPDIFEATYERVEP